MMKLVCAWCGAAIERSGYDPNPDTHTSHGMCRSCSQALVSQEHGSSLQQHIDGIEVPILLVDEENMTLAMNARAREILGSKPESASGAQIGRVFDCLHSQLPEGCGRTIHCSGCVIRRCVTDTFRTGKPQVAVPATLSVDSAERPSDIVFAVTTVKNGNVVLMRIDRMRRGSSE